MTVIVLKKGFVSAIQDLGRFGYQRYGIIVGGVMDAPAAKLANWLVTNSSDEAVIEFSFMGPSLQFEQDTLFALTGAECEPKLDGRPIGSGRPIVGRRGQILTTGGLVNGCRGYLALAGGMDVPTWFGSRSTDARAHVGGFHGRSLREGDRIEAGRLSPVQKQVIDRLNNEEHLLPWYFATQRIRRGTQTIRVMPDQHWPLFKESGRQAFLHSEYQTTPSSDRMGYRLIGKKIELDQPFSLFSEAVTQGSIQVPPSGLPIILMADHQSTGGYPRIAQVAAVDLPLLGQLSPGSRLHFRKITVADAERLFLSAARKMDSLQKRVARKVTELSKSM
ncbi:MAG: biotin-dependent carboxyltransferase family protein [Sporolactobacillus sp.]